MAPHLYLFYKPSRSSCSICSDTDIEIKAWQVMELEESRNSLLQENLRLTEIVSGMQSQIQSLEKSIVSSCAVPVATMVSFLCPSFLAYLD